MQLFHSYQNMRTAQLCHLQGLSQHLLRCQSSYGTFQKLCTRFQRYHVLFDACTVPISLRITGYICISASETITILCAKWHHSFIKKLDWYEIWVTETRVVWKFVGCVVHVYVGSTLIYSVVYFMWLRPRQTFHFAHDIFTFISMN